MGGGPGPGKPTMEWIADGVVQGIDPRSQSLPRNASLQDLYGLLLDTFDLEVGSDVRRLRKLMESQGQESASDLAAVARSQGSWNFLVDQASVDYQIARVIKVDFTKSPITPINEKLTFCSI